MFWRVEELQLGLELRQSSSLSGFVKIDPRFFQSIRRGAQLDARHPSELHKAGVSAVGRRKKNIGVEKDAFHLSRPPMGNSIRIQT